MHYFQSIWSKASEQLQSQDNGKPEQQQQADSGQWPQIAQTVPNKSEPFRQPDSFNMEI